MTGSKTESRGGEASIANISRALHSEHILNAPLRSHAFTLLVGGCLALNGVTSGTATPASYAPPQGVRVFGDWTTSQAPRRDDATPRESQPPSDGATTAVMDADLQAAETTTTASDVLWLHDASGLTWEQLGRVFGVSRRAVHLWANGGRMNGPNAELLGELVGLVRRLPGTSPEYRRTILFAPNSDGVSLFDQIRARQKIDQRVAIGNPFKPEELLPLNDHESGAPLVRRD